MIDIFNNIATEFDFINAQLSDNTITSDHNKLRELSKKQKELSSLAEMAKKYIKLHKEVEEAKSLLKSDKDNEMHDFYKETIEDNTKQLSSIQQEYYQYVREQNSDDNRNVIVEVRAGTGGEEAALFAADIYRMYLKYAEKKSWQVEQITSNRTGNGGFKEVIFFLTGEYVYGTLKYENGVHRVQRIPSTEAAGRIHTSAVSVVVLPEVEDIEVKVNEEDLKIDVYRSSGPGGQSVNTTDSAVRITHIPSGIVVSCQDEKSQIKNKSKALAVLKSRLYDIELEQKQSEASEQRQSSIRGGDRSVKIKTYNFPQGRVTDHRIKHTWHKLENILDGDLDEMLKTTENQLRELH